METIIKDGQKWEIKKLEEYKKTYEVKYYEYSKICKCWNYISKWLCDEELAGDKLFMEILKGN